MREGSERRTGFGGQSLNVELRGEHELVADFRAVDSDRAGGSQLNRILNRAFGKAGAEHLGRFAYLEELDEYGTTVFNQNQLYQVIPELHRLRPAAKGASEQEALDRVIELAVRCKDDSPGCFLVFLGD